MPAPLWPGGPLLEQAPEVFPLGTDSILLADFACPGARDRLLDLGTGCGILPIVLLWDRPGVTATAVELSPAACALARKNLTRNGLEQRVCLLEQDLRQFRQTLPAGGFDLTVSNPPYFPAGSGFSGPLENARQDTLCTLPQLCAAAAWSTRWGGRFCLVFPPARLCELFAALTECGFAPKRIRPVHHAPGLPVNLLLVEARRGGKPGLVWEPDLYLHTAQGQESPEYQRIYRRTP